MGLSGGFDFVVAELGDDVAQGEAVFLVIEVAVDAFVHGVDGFLCVGEGAGEGGDGLVVALVAQFVDAVPEDALDAFVDIDGAQALGREVALAASEEGLVQASEVFGDDGLGQAEIGGDLARALRSVR